MPEIYIKSNVGVGVKIKQSKEDSTIKVFRSNPEFYQDNSNKPKFKSLRHFIRTSINEENILKQKQTTPKHNKPIKDKTERAISKLKLLGIEITEESIKKQILIAKQIRRENQQKATKINKAEKKKQKRLKRRLDRESLTKNVKP